MPYYAYVLRLWPEHETGGATCWRFALVEPQTGRRLGFGNLAALVAHLEDLTESGAEGDGQPSAPAGSPRQAG